MYSDTLGRTILAIIKIMVSNLYNISESNRLIKEVLDLEIFDFTTGDSLFYADYASNTSLETAAERLDLRGGQGNYKLLSFDHTKNMMLKTELPLVDLEFVALLTGRAMEVGTTEVPKRQVLTVGAGNTVTLAATPTSGTRVYLINDRDVGTEQTLGAPAATPNKYSVSGAVLTLNATSAPTGTKVVVTYKYNAPATTRRMVMSADKFAKYCRIVGTGIVTDQVTGAEYVSKFEILKAKPQNNFTITMQSTEATKLDITWDLYSVDETTDSGDVRKIYVNFYELV